MILYRVALTLISPLIAAFFFWRIAQRKERVSGLDERLGGPAGRPSGEKGARLWLHGASNGELTAIRPLIDQLLADIPSLTIILTCNSVTGRTLAKSWGLPRVTARLAPLDFAWCQRRFLSHHRPTAVAIVENELWPNKIRVARALGHPIALIGARLSEKSAARWGKLSWLIRPMLQAIDLALPQDTLSGRRLTTLGLPQGALGDRVALKAAVALAAPPSDAVAALGFERSETLLAASTHEGEEEQVLEAFMTARQVRPYLRLILAPRHPPRGPRVAALIEETGTDFAVRSRGEAPDAAPIYLADTLGEMPLWYAAAGICFVGGSLVEKGGHTPFEPAQFFCALISGPHVENAADPFAQLAEAGAVEVVGDASELADAVVRLTPARQGQLGRLAAEVLGSGSVAPAAAKLTEVLRLTREAREQGS